MKLKMTEGSEKYGAPPGLYRTKFLGAKADTHPEYGAGLKWEFEVTEGPMAGKIVGRTTSPAPTLKNGCGKMLQMLTGGTAALHQEFDLDQYVGREFQVMVETNSTGTGTRVGSVMPMTGDAPASAPAGPPPARRPAPAVAGRRRGGDDPAAQSARLAARYWIEPPDGQVQEVTGQQLQLRLNACRTQAEVDEIGVMDYAQTCHGWRTPGHFGFKPEIPF